MFAIETRALRKVFGSKVAVQDLTVTVRRGEVFGFLGPNGAGKTTSVKMLLGLVHPSSGDADVLGKPLGDTSVRAKLGFLPEHFRFHDWLTGREFLRIHGRMHGLTGQVLESRINTLLERVSLGEAANRMVRTYSKGMTQRIGMAQALINQPELVFFDEPTSGLDPLGRLLVRDVINELRGNGAAVFLNSHLLSEVEITCDRVAFVKQGSVVREMSLGEDERALELTLRLGAMPARLESELAAFGKDLRVTSNANTAATLVMQISDEAHIPEISRWLVGQGIDVFHVSAKRPSLESLFLQVLGDEQPG
jgi:ABC-2 type transport system ATP-binding protein